MEQDLHNYYRLQLEANKGILLKLKQKSFLYLIAKLIAFFLFVCFAYFTYSQRSQAMLIMALIGLTTYIYINIRDDKNQKQLNLVRRISKTYQNESTYLDGDFTPFANGSKYINPDHSFTFDLDIFGKDSLFNRINRTITKYGSDKLAHDLQILPISGDKTTQAQVVTEKQEAIKELSDMEPWRSKFQSLPVEENYDLNKLLQQIHQKHNIKNTNFWTSFIFILLLGTSIAITIILFILNFFGVIAWIYPAIMFSLQLMITIGFSTRLMKIAKDVSKMHQELKGYVSLIQHISKTNFKSKLNSKLYNQLFGHDINALTAFRQLSRICSDIDRRANLLTFVLFNGLYYNDLLLVRRFEIWKKEYVSHIEDWMYTIGTFDALVSMGTYRFNTPNANDATVCNVPTLCYKAKGLYHPFLKSNMAVANDCQLDANHFYIITGANMAGKSTFLRSIGINYVLAMNGMPVCASSYKVSFFNLFTSMRIADNLSHNVSYFNAELLRIEAMIKSCKQHTHTLIILDEILRGTNSKDKLDGSKLFLKEITKLPVTGVVATHDLQLSKLEEEDHERFQNYCFEIELGHESTFTYKIQRGVAQNMNATFLLKRILNDNI